MNSLNECKDRSLCWNVWSFFFFLLHNGNYFVHVSTRLFSKNLPSVVKRSPSFIKQLSGQCQLSFVSLVLRGTVGTCYSLLSLCSWSLTTEHNVLMKRYFFFWNFTERIILQQQSDKNQDSTSSNWCWRVQCLSCNMSHISVALCWT